MKFDMGRAWSDAVALLSANRQVVLIVAGVFFFLPYLALMLLMPDQIAEMQSAGASTGGADPQVAFNAVMEFYGSIWWALVLMAVIQGIGMLGLITLLTDRARPTVGQALASGAKAFLPYLGTQILQMILLALIVLVPITIGALISPVVAVLLGLVAAVGAIYVMTKLSMTIPVIAIDRVMNPVRAMTRSWRLTKGNSVRLFFFYVLLFVVMLVITLVLASITGLLSVFSAREGSAIIGGVINGLMNMIVVTLLLAILAAVHRQLSGDTPEQLSETFG
jgi:hypothetical protein